MRNKELALTTYKLLHDALALAILFWAGMILIEIFLPGFIAEYVGHTALLIIIGGLVATIAWLGRKYGIAPVVQPENSEKEMYFPIIFGLTTGLALLSALFRFDWWEMIIATAAAIAAFFLLSGKKL